MREVLARLASPATSVVDRRVNNQSPNVSHVVSPPRQPPQQATSSLNTQSNQVPGCGEEQVPERYPALGALSPKTNPLSQMVSPRDNESIVSPRLPQIEVSPSKTDDDVEATTPIQDSVRSHVQESGLVTGNIRISIDSLPLILSFVRPVRGDTFLSPPKRIS